MLAALTKHISSIFDAFVHDVGPFGRPILKTKLQGAFRMCEKFLGEMPCCIINLWNDPSWYGVSKSENTPRLLRQSHLYDLKTRKELLPVTHFLMMGLAPPLLSFGSISDLAMRTHAHTYIFCVVQIAFCAAKRLQTMQMNNINGEIQFGGRRLRGLRFERL